MNKRRIVNDRDSKYDFWRVLKRCRDEFLNSQWDLSSKDPTVVNNCFYDYLQRTYGIKLQLVDGSIGPDYVIDNEKKYMLFQLKFT